MTTLRNAAMMALGALEYIDSPLSVIEIEIVGRAIAALDAALEQQEKQDETRDSLERYTQEVRTILNGAAKREWQGLTDEEIWSDGSRMGLSEDGIRRFAREIEAKLKEKNA